MRMDVVKLKGIPGLSAYIPVKGLVLMLRTVWNKRINYKSVINTLIRHV
jgi:hypothetical protein